MGAEHSSAETMRNTVWPSDLDASTALAQSNFPRTHKPPLASLSMAYHSISIESIDIILLWLDWIFADGGLMDVALGRDAFGEPDVATNGRFSPDCHEAEDRRARIYNDIVLDDGVTR